MIISRSAWASGDGSVAERGLPPEPVISVLPSWLAVVRPVTLCQLRSMLMVSGGGGGGAGGFSLGGVVGADGVGGASNCPRITGAGGAAGSDSRALKSASFVSASAAGVARPSLTGGGAGLGGGASAASVAAGLGGALLSSGAGARVGCGGAISAAALMATRPAISAKATLPTWPISSLALIGESVKTTCRPGCSMLRIAKSRSTCWVPSFRSSTTSVPDTTTLATEALVICRFRLPLVGTV